MRAPDWRSYSPDMRCATPPDSRVRLSPSAARKDGGAVVEAGVGVRRGASSRCRALAVGPSAPP